MTPAIALVATVAAASPVTRADSVRGVSVLDARPLVVRGGVFMARLDAERHGDRWPKSITLTLEGGTTVEGHVAWIHVEEAPPADRRWTEELVAVTVRAIDARDDSSRGDGYPILLARMPAEATGDVRIGAQVIAPRWLEPPRRGAAIGSEPDVAPSDRPDRPDPRTPFAYWRWALIADRVGATLFAPEVYGEVGALVAEHQADLWRCGLDRLAGASPGVAAACQDLLTRTCRDGDEAFAAWITDAQRLEILFRTLLDLDRSASDAARGALAWADAQMPLLAWTEVAFGGSARVAIVNRGTRPVMARLAWAGRDDPPIAVELPPGALSRVTVDRPPPPPPARGPLAAPSRESAREVLVVDTSVHTLRLNVGPRAVEVRPPGVSFPAFRAPLTLAEIEAGKQRVVPLERMTSLQVRRRAGRWEAFVECRRPPGAASGGAGVESQMARATSAADLRGLEAIVLSVGAEAEVVALAIPEEGPIRFLGGAADPGVSVHRRSYADRWLCRIVLPEAWVAPPASTVDPIFTTPDDLVRERWFLLGCLRAHGDSPALETTPGIGVPWRLSPARAALDLSAWTDVP
jgi:hypothetical protein